jgi:hypothetical protein
MGTLAGGSRGDRADRHTGRCGTARVTPVASGMGYCFGRTDEWHSRHCCRSIKHDGATINGTETGRTGSHRERPLHAQRICYDRPEEKVTDRP